MRYRRKAKVTEAWQFREAEHLPRGVMRAPGEGKGGAFVTTIHGQRVYLEDGDWILPEPDGVHFYPVKPAVFELMYEPEGAPDVVVPLSLQAQIGSIVVHAQEMVSTRGHVFDLMAVESLLEGEEVQAWLTGLGPLLPVKR